MDGPKLKFSNPCRDCAGRSTLQTQTSFKPPMYNELVFKRVRTPGTRAKAVAVTRRDPGTLSEPAEA